MVNFFGSHLLELITGVGVLANTIHKWEIGDSDEMYEQTLSIGMKTGELIANLFDI